MTQKPLALITGAAQGIGYASAQSLIDEGFDVILSDINAEGVAAAAKKLNAVGSIDCDMGDAKQIEDMFKQIADNHRPIHALVNNAGVALPGDFLDYSLADFERVINVNMRSVFIATQLVARMMIEHKIEGDQGSRAGAC